VTIAVPCRAHRLLQAALFFSFFSFLLHCIDLSIECSTIDSITGDGLQCALMVCSIRRFSLVGRASSLQSGRLPSISICSMSGPLFTSISSSSGDLQISPGINWRCIFSSLFSIIYFSCFFFCIQTFAHCAWLAIFVGLFLRKLHRRSSLTLYIFFLLFFNVFPFDSSRLMVCLLALCSF